MGKFRRGVVAVIINEKNQVLLGERSDMPGVWQFPQGGIEGKETSTQAFFRELEEELGNGQCKILKISKGTTKYKWPKPGRGRLGQEHTWFLASYKKAQAPNLKKSDHCFRDWKWEDPTKVLAQTIDWKRAAFKKGMTMLGLKLVDNSKKSSGAIFAITPNPALDLSGIVKNLKLNEKAYVLDEKRAPGGNAINAARILHRLKTPVIATGFMGGSTGEEIEALLKTETVNCQFIHVAGSSRVNVTVSEQKSGQQTRLSFAGPVITVAEKKNLFSFF